MYYGDTIKGEIKRLWQHYLKKKYDKHKQEIKEAIDDFYRGNSEYRDINS